MLPIMGHRQVATLLHAAMKSTTAIGNVGNAIFYRLPRQPRGTQQLRCKMSWTAGHTNLWQTLCKTLRLGIYNILHLLLCSVRLQV